MPPTPPPIASPAPDAAALREAALAHLARFATTEAGLVRVLDRRIARWSRTALAAGTDAETVAATRALARHQARAVAAALRAQGAVDDASFAETRARRLLRAGRSRRAIAAHLAAHGVTPEVSAGALASDDAAELDAAELGAALVLARRRRIGPFRAADRNPEAADAGGERSQREAAILARAGFSRATAEQALALTPDAAERLIAALRTG